MAEAVSKVTRKGQVTVPVAIRRVLDIKEGDQVAFSLDNGTVKLTRQAGYAERTKGAVKSDRPHLSAEQLRAEAEAAIAQGAAERGGE